MSPQIVTDWPSDRKVPTLEQGLKLLVFLNKHRRSQKKQGRSCSLSGSSLVAHKPVHIGFTDAVNPFVNPLGSKLIFCNQVIDGSLAFELQVLGYLFDSQYLIGLDCEVRSFCCRVAASIGVPL
jgi:hypothetical protein